MAAVLKQLYIPSLVRAVSLSIGLKNDHRSCLCLNVLRASSSSSSTPSEWAGLYSWRTSPVDERRFWGADNTSTDNQKQEQSFTRRFTVARKTPSSLAEWGALVLNTPDPISKAAFTHHAYRLWSRGDLPLGVSNAPDIPARPDKPVLVPIKQVPDVKSSPLPANAHSLHILAHIELNAVDLAWDTIVRFSKAGEELGRQFFSDFVHVADDESRHFCWCSQRLSELGYCYGDMPAHNALLDESQRSSANVMARLAIVPMVQEARGLDSGPRLVSRLVGRGDVRSASIVSQISQEELAHVAVGVSWFLAVCKRMNRAPDITFKDLLQEFKIELKGPFNHNARAEAGLPRNWYDLEYQKQSFDLESKNVGLNSEELEAKISFQGNSLHALPSALPQNSESPNSCLPQVYDRLALMVAMENERAA